MRFPISDKGKSGNPGGRPKVLADVQELARQHLPAAIAELARLGLKREERNGSHSCLPRASGPGLRQAATGIEITPPPSADPFRLLLDEIAADGHIENRYENPVA